MTSCSDRCRPGSPCMVSRDGICEQPARVYVPATTAKRNAELKQERPDPHIKPIPKHWTLRHS